MTGTWINSIQECLLEAFPPTRPYSPAEFDHAPMPETVAHFLRHALRRRVDEFDMSVKPEWFDYSDPQLVDAEKAWRAALFEAAHFPTEMWRQTLQQAVRLVAAHLLSPEETLARFIFGPRSDSLDVQIVSDRLGYFKAYPALAEVLRGYFKKKGLKEISRPDFSRILVRADRTLTADYTADKWMKVLAPLYEMAPLAYADDVSTSLPVSVVRSFFEAKGRHDISSAILADQGSLASTRVNEAELARILNDVDQAGGLVIDPPKPKEVHVPDHNHVPRRYELHRPSDSGVPRWVRFRKPDAEVEAAAPEGNGVPALSDKPGPSGNGALPSKHKSRQNRIAFELDTSTNSAATDDIPRWRRLQEEDAEPKNGLSKSVECESRVLGNLDVSQRDLFIEKLFAGDQAAYLSTIDKLDHVDSWDEAVEIVANNVFRRFAVNIYEEPAISFTNAIESRFAASD